MKTGQSFVYHTNELIDVRFVSPKGGFLRADLTSSAQEQDGKRGGTCHLQFSDVLNITFQDVVLCVFVASSRKKLDRKDYMNTHEIKEKRFSLNHILFTELRNC